MILKIETFKDFMILQPVLALWTIQHYTTNKTTYSRKKSKNCFFDFKAEIRNQNTGCRGIFSAETIRTFDKEVTLENEDKTFR